MFSQEYFDGANLRSLIYLMGVALICLGFSELLLRYLANTDDLGFELYKNLSLIGLLAIGCERLLAFIINSLFGPVPHRRKNYRLKSSNAKIVQSGMLNGLKNSGRSLRPASILR